MVQCEQVAVAVIGDDEDVRLLLEVLVQVDDRFRLAVASGCGAGVLDTVHAAEPDAVLLDLDGAPDGLALVGELRSATDALIVVVSEFPDPHTLLTALAEGADSCIARGQAWSELLPAVLAARELAAQP